MEIASWRTYSAKALGSLEFGGSHSFSKWEAPAVGHGEGEGETRLTHVRVLCFRYAFKVGNLALSRLSAKKYQSRELGQFSIVITHIMPTQLNL